ncbi:GNAT family N-acetyltransferase [Ensifer sp. SL37]|uniref:GNAT family N-acetyltransferase n=1 Tax=Ensifer sp. SL37 TaxID=2995137 RepID=UPI0022764F23|nr:GNAT family N-acetyltransferase [Ensifer sp. SL37]MCY1740484.1 GNAT family N-acetyltransferase [Ensifer sp. SL37]
MSTGVCDFEIRSFVETDAEGISQLFRTVYGDNYVYPDVYLPAMIRRRNATRCWQSMVAVSNGHVIGHAALWYQIDLPDQVEFALNTVHPSARGNGIATQLAHSLCERARRQGYATLTIKQVSSHGQSQRLARNLGFQTTALMFDYVDSPFGGKNRESIILGCLALQPRPIPAIDWPGDYSGWIAPLSCNFGSTPAEDNHFSVAPLAIESRERRIDVTLSDLRSHHVQDVANLPFGRLTYVRLALARDTPFALKQLGRAGYYCTGLTPGPQRQWFALMVRGHRTPKLDLHCPIAIALHESRFIGMLPQVNKLRWQHHLRYDVA